MTVCSCVCVCVCVCVRTLGGGVESGFLSRGGRKREEHPLDGEHSHLSGPACLPAGAPSLCQAPLRALLCQPGHVHQGGPAPGGSGLPAAGGVHPHAEGAAQPGPAEQHAGGPPGHPRGPGQRGTHLCQGGWASEKAPAEFSLLGPRPWGSTSGVELRFAETFSVKAERSEGT